MATGSNTGTSQPKAYPSTRRPLHFYNKWHHCLLYVDDIIIVNHPNFAKQATKLDQDLKKEWEMRELDATWFLNIRILRDRDQKKLWLCQDSYIESMTNKYNLVTTRKVGSPLGVEPLVPYDGVATPSQIHGYQAKLDLLKFLTNPGPKHMDAIDRIIQYSMRPGIGLLSTVLDHVMLIQHSPKTILAYPLLRSQLNSQVMLLLVTTETGRARKVTFKQNFLPSQKQEKPSNGGAESSIH
ncbi:hypothetical protein PDIDSM_6959 [Penicillium digitatum]|nr:hypothetical protein PDIDSM_6959 [Penicillium digitatum]